MHGFHALEDGSVLITAVGQGNVVLGGAAHDLGEVPQALLVKLPPLTR